MILPSIIEAVEFRRNAYSLSQKQWAFVIGMQQSHYNEFVNGKRCLPRKAMTKCFEYGVPAMCLFQCRANKGIKDIKTKLKELNK